MKNLPPAIFQYLGVLTNGDMGPYTFYTSHRKRLVFFLKTWPKDPATYNQALNRNRWKQAGFRWRNLTDETKQLWATLGRRANCTVSGYNLYMFYILDKNRSIIQTLERNTGIDVQTPTGEPLPPSMF